MATSRSKAATSWLGDLTHIHDLCAVRADVQGRIRPELSRPTQTAERGIWVDQYAPYGAFLAHSTPDLSGPTALRRLGPAARKICCSSECYCFILNIRAEELQCMRPRKASTSYGAADIYNMSPDLDRFRRSFTP